MTDLEITKLCALAMGYEDVHIAHGCMGTAYVKCGGIGSVTQGIEFRPLHDDAQAMAVVKKFSLSLNGNDDGSRWEVVYFRPDSEDEIRADGENLNRVIVETVAAIHLANLGERK